MAVASIVLNPESTFYQDSWNTQFHPVIFRFMWTIQDYHMFWKLSKRQIQSSTFTNFDENGLKWYLEINASLEPYMILFLHLDTNNIECIMADCHFSVLNAKLEPVHKYSTEAKFTKKENYITFNFIENSILFEESDKFLPDKTLTILCEIYIIEKQTDFLGQYAIRLPPRFNLGLALFQDVEFSDVTFRVGTRELRAHKVILAARSQAFKAMFQHDFIEKITNVVEIKDFDYEVVKEMLEYIYTNKTSNLDLVAHNLFTAADKYEIKGLQFLCKNAMIKNLSIENAAQYYLIANQHTADELKMRIQSFIVNNYSGVLETSGFQLAFEINPKLFTDLRLLELS